MKRLSFQWRITLLTAILIASACISLNLLLYRSGAVGMDTLNGFVLEYQTGDAEELTIQIPDEQLSGFLNQFAQEVCDVKTDFGQRGWFITGAVTLLSAAIAYFISGQALKPLRQLSEQADRINQESLNSNRLDENAIKEFRQMSRSVNRMLDRLAASFEQQRQFTGNAAHEMRTPLALMQSKLELFLEEHTDADGGTAELARFQLAQVERLAALVRTLLEMCTLQTVPRSDPIELAPLVDEILTDLTPLAQERQVKLRQKCEEVRMTGSDALIYRLICNLVENAVKYNRLGGSVCVSVRQEGGNALLRIADTGIGIPQDAQESIFHPFFRVDKSRSRRMGGVGLGLALVREIALLHGGTVWIEASSPQGTTFAVTLPLRQEDGTSG